MLTNSKKIILASFIIPILVVIYLEVFYNFILVNGAKYLLLNIEDIKLFIYNFINDVSIKKLFKIIYTMFQIGLFITLWDFRKSEIKRKKAYLLEEKLMNIF